MHAVFALAVASACALLTACALPAHNNTLIFGVKRDVGVGIKGPSETSASVELTLGYSERQFAWVPVWANMADSNGKTMPMPCPASKDKPIPNDPKSGTDTTTLNKATDFKQVNCNYGPKLLADGDGAPAGKGRINDGHDALSTFASFGGDLQGGIKGDSASNIGGSVAGKLASFFATGIAAQNLSKQTGLVSPIFANRAASGDATDDENTETVKQQMNVVAQFISATGAGNADGAKRTVRTECGAVLAKRADLTGDVLQQFNKLSAPVPPASAVTTGQWKDRWFDERKTFTSDLPYLARAADNLSKEFDLEMRKRGADKGAEAVCLQKPISNVN